MGGLRGHAGLTGPAEVYASVDFNNLEWDAVVGEMKTAYSAKFNQKVAGILDRGGRQMINAIHSRINLSPDGPPGVRYITGDYYKSWRSTVMGRFSKHPQLVVSTNAPQARRLEYGFVGTDSIGRNYNQPPYPHAGLAFDEVMPSIEAEIILIAGLEFVL